MTSDNKEIKEKLKKCRDWKDYENILKENGFEHVRTSGGHKQFKKDGNRTIPIQAHGKPPSGGLKSQLVKQILGAITCGCFFFFIIYPNMFTNIV